METLTPQDFLAFRPKLGTASGFQSFQIREVELVLGLQENMLAKIGEKTAYGILETSVSTIPGGKEQWQKVTDAKTEVTLKAALEQWLYRTPIFGSGPTDKGDAEVVNSFLTEYISCYKKYQIEQAEDLITNNLGNRESVYKRTNYTIQFTENFVFASDVQDQSEKEKLKRVRAAMLFIESYRNLPLLAWPRLLLDGIIELEEQFVIWRSRHARMVERIIGRRIGTGGSSGVDYLDSTTKYRVFDNLWTVRTAILPENCVPQLKNPEFYGFKNS